MLPDRSDDEYVLASQNYALSNSYSMTYDILDNEYQLNHHKEFFADKILQIKKLLLLKVS